MQRMWEIIRTPSSDSSIVRFSYLAKIILKYAARLAGGRELSVMHTVLLVLFTTPLLNLALHIETGKDRPARAPLVYQQAPLSGLLSPIVKYTTWNPGA